MHSTIRKDDQAIDPIFINLRNNMDGFSLQMLMGHSTMEMVSTYLHIAQADLENGHRRASSVDNWKL